MPVVMHSFHVIKIFSLLNVKDPNVPETNGKKCVYLLNKLLMHSVPLCSKRSYTRPHTHHFSKCYVSEVSFPHYLSIWTIVYHKPKSLLYCMRICFYLGKYDNGHNIGLIAVILVFDRRFCSEGSALAFFSHTETKQQLSNYFKTPGRNPQPHSPTYRLSQTYTHRYPIKYLGQNDIKDVACTCYIAALKKLCVEAERIDVSFKFSL